MISTRKEELKSILTPDQAKTDELAATVMAASTAISTAEAEVEALKAQVERFSHERAKLDNSLAAFQNKFKIF